MQIIQKVGLLFVLVVTSPSYAQQAEFIWAEDDRVGSRIYHSQYKNGAWQTGIKIVDDSNLNILPALSRDSKGRSVAVWSTIMDASSILKFSVKLKNGWQKPKILTDQMTTNLAPVVVIDHNDIPWVFWSANTGGDDDIYRSIFLKGKWTTPQMVNESNQLPDILPEAGTDETGNIWVSWQTLQNNVYVEVAKSFDVTTKRKMAVDQSFNTQRIRQLKLHSDNINSIKPPTFFKARSRATLYFSGDKIQPSKAIQGNINQ